MTGIVYLVGAGPGAADLLTLRAARLLARADIVFHDALVPPAILALASRAEKVEVGKRSGRHSLVEYASLPGARKLSGTLAQLPALAQRCGHGPVAILMGEVYRDAAASNIIASWPNEKSSEHSSSSPTARAIRSGRGRSSSS